MCIRFRLCVNDINYENSDKNKLILQRSDDFDG